MGTLSRMMLELSPWGLFQIYLILAGIGVSLAVLFAAGCVACVLWRGRYFG